MKIIKQSIFSILEKVCNLFILNTLFLVSCIPIVTIFPAMISVYSVLKEWDIHQENAVVKPYFKELKKNLKVGLYVEILWIIFVLFICMLFSFINSLEGIAKEFGVVVFLITVVLLLSFSVFSLPLLAEYKIDLRKIFLTVFKVSFSFFSTTVILIMITAISMIFLIIFPPSMYFIFSLYGYVSYKILNEKFKIINQIKQFT